MNTILGLENIDIHAEFLTELLKDGHIEQITDYENYAINHYSWKTWRKILFKDRDRKILRTPEEIKEVVVHGSIFLANIRSNIALIAVGMAATNLPEVLNGIVRDFLPWQFWYLEKILSTIQNDIFRYAGSMAALLSKAKPLPEHGYMIDYDMPPKLTS